MQHEYMGYMEKKTTKRQTTIITLSDHNKQEIRNIELQKEIMEEEFNDQEKGSFSSLTLNQTTKFWTLPNWKHLQTTNLLLLK